MERHEKIFFFTIAAMAAILVFLFLLQLARTDYSARQNEKRRKFGAVYMTLNNPFYEIIDETLRAEIERRGDVLLSRNPALRADLQDEEIKDLINEGVSILFVNPAEKNSIDSALQKAKENRVPIIAIDTEIDGDYAVCTVTSDNYQAGVLLAEHMISHSGGGRIAILTHSSAQSAIDRVRGFKDTIEGHEEFSIAAERDCMGQLELAMPAMEDILASEGIIDIVMAINDPSALGAIAALEKFGLAEGAMVYGVDGTSEAYDMILSGYMTATAVQEPEKIGETAGEAAYKILDGDAPPARIVLPTRLVTKEILKNAESKKNYGETSP